ncbi:60S ribosomal protein L26-2 [Spatholobus suberectus]|nr:60S ribosomal protein L26-2 [Spatholobus suberectus]
MKFNPRVSSSRRKAHLNTPSSVRRILISAPLSSDLRSKYNVAPFWFVRMTRCKSCEEPTRAVKARSFKSIAASG